MKTLIQNTTRILFIIFIGAALSAHPVFAHGDDEDRADAARDELGAIEDLEEELRGISSDIENLNEELPEEKNEDILREFPHGAPVPRAAGILENDPAFPERAFLHIKEAEEHEEELENESEDEREHRDELIFETKEDFLEDILEDLEDLEFEDIRISGDLIDEEAGEEFARPASVVIEAHDIKNSALFEQAREAGLAIPEAHEVEDDEDLFLFAADLAELDESIEALEYSLDTVRITYEQPAKLFGFIPVTIASETTVIARGDEIEDIEVDMPWWHILTRKTLSAEKIEEAVQNMEESVNASLRAIENASAQSAIRLDSVVSAVKKAHEAALRALQSLR